MSGRVLLHEQLDQGLGTVRIQLVDLRVDVGQDRARVFRVGELTGELVDEENVPDADRSFREHQKSRGDRGELGRDRQRDPQQGPGMVMVAMLVFGDVVTNALEPGVRPHSVSLPRPDPVEYQLPVVPAGTKVRQVLVGGRIAGIPGGRWMRS